MAPAAANAFEPAMVEVLELDEHDDLSATAVRVRARDALEGGDIVLLPGRGFVPTERERQVISARKAMLRDGMTRGHHGDGVTLTFDHRINRLLTARIRGPERREIEAMLRRYAVWSRGLLQALLPEFAAACEGSRIVYRPVGREKAHGLHIDSSHFYPTQGRGKLCVFCNIDPEGQPRVWEVGERFEPYAVRYLPAAQGTRSWSKAAIERCGSLIGVINGKRTAYDLLLEDMRRRAKRDTDYQKGAPRRAVKFPAGTAWLALTDIVLHRAISGQHSIDEVFFLPAIAMHDPSRSGLRILERLSGQTLA